MEVFNEINMKYKLSEKKWVWIIMQNDSLKTGIKAD